MADVREQLSAAEQKAQKEEQDQIEQELQAQITKQIQDLEKSLKDQLDKFGEAMFAFLKSTGQTKPKPQPSAGSHDAKK